MFWFMTLSVLCRHDLGGVEHAIGKSLVPSPSIDRFKSTLMMSSPILQPYPVASPKHYYFFVMVTNLPQNFQLLCRMFAGDTKFVGRSDNVSSIQLHLDRAVE